MGLDGADLDCFVGWSLRFPINPVYLCHMKRLNTWLLGTLLLTLFAASCSEEQPSLVGHWHLYWRIEGQGEPIYTPVNFLSDSIGVTLYRNQPSSSIYRPPNSDTLYIHDGHGNSPLIYVWLHPDTITLLNANYGQNALLIREQPTLSDLYSDHFSESLYRYEVQLDTRKCTSERVRPVLEHQVRIGKNNLPQVYEQDYVYILGDMIVPELDTSQLWMYAEQHRVKLREHMRDSIIPTLYVDKNAPDSMVDQLTTYYKRSGFQQVAYMYVDTLTQPDTVLFCPTIVRLD